MKGNIIKIVWGVLLVALGGLVLADRFGYLGFDLKTPVIWTIIFSVISAAFFLTYFLKGIRHWGLLFPALIFVALALTISPLLIDSDDPAIAFPFLICIAIPFYVGYALDRKHWGRLVPAWVMTVIAFIPLLDERINSDLLASLFLFSFALPFLAGYLVDQRRKWAFITAAVLGFIGIFPLINLFVHGDILGPLVMFLFTLPFVLTFIASRRNWWALIPGGLFASIGVVALLNTLFPHYGYISVNGYELGIYSCVLFLGLAITFGLLWHLRTSQPTAWALYPAAGLLATSLSAFLMGRSFEAYLPAVVLLVTGAVLVAATIFKGRVTRQTSS